MLSRGRPDITQPEIIGFSCCRSCFLDKKTRYQSHPMLAVKSKCIENVCPPVKDIPFYARRECIKNYYHIDGLMSLCGCCGRVMPQSGALAHTLYVQISTCCAMCIEEDRQISSYYTWLFCAFSGFVGKDVAGLIMELVMRVKKL